MIVSKPDKYERWVGLKDIERHWVWDNYRQCWHQKRNYPIEVLERIYLLGYRDEGFRGETVEEAFKRIQKLPYGQSENRYRVNWFLRHFKQGRLLDIGAGLGVFAYELKTHGWDVEATEENLYSKSFIRGKLMIPCYAPHDVIDEYDVVSVIHVLEHIKDLSAFFRYLKRHVKDGGRLFVEVPDAVEFVYLPKTSDEFNSCHVWFFDVPALYRLVSKYFTVNDIHCAYYEKRKRSRILLSATKQS